MLIYTQLYEKTMEDEEIISDYLMYGISMRRPTLTVMLKEVTEFLILFFLYINVRPRNWPPFYSLELGED